MKKILALIVALTLVLSMGMAFAETLAPEDMDIAYICTSTNDYWTTLNQGLNDAAEAAGINVQTSLVEENDIAGAVAALSLIHI